jgi:large subunit ribosomal protein L25
MKVTMTKRTAGSKSELNQIRREGDIPAVLYGLSRESQTVRVKGTEFQAHLRSIPQGRLSTQLFELSLDGQVVKALVKNIHYHPSTYVVEHLDFFIPAEGRPVTVKVPIELVGVADCIGVKLGGILRSVIRTLPVSCAPNDIPAAIQVDIRHLDLGGIKRLSDLPLPPNVRPLARMNEVAVVVAKAKTA